ncbi:MAG: hypothetical protein GX453_05785 [Lactococcus chungangensis]|uniref:Uncharacterized protein n=1 Tax=Pseudolactococcus chungangensis TaxID=451457 RepID=A0A847J2E6_9LACT|nr:hypothetical protein [Lactococcus chungangensis]
MLCKHHFSKNGQVFFHIFWVVTLIMQSRLQSILYFLYLVKPAYFEDQQEYRVGLTLDDPIDANELFIPIHDLRKYVKSE